MTDKPLIYVAGRFSGPDDRAIHENIRVAAEWAHRIRELGCYALTPHLIGAPYVGLGLSLPDIFGYEHWIRETKAMLRLCHAAFFAPGWVDSRGALGEHDDATNRGQPVFFDLESVEAFAKAWPS